MGSVSKGTLFLPVMEVANNLHDIIRRMAPETGGLGDLGVEYVHVLPQFAELVAKVSKDQQELASALAAADVAPLSNADEQLSGSWAIRSSPEWSLNVMATNSLRLCR